MLLCCTCRCQVLRCGNCRQLWAHVVPMVFSMHGCPGGAAAEGAAKRASEAAPALIANHAIHLPYLAALPLVPFCVRASAEQDYLNVIEIACIFHVASWQLLAVALSMLRALGYHQLNHLHRDHQFV